MTNIKRERAGPVTYFIWNVGPYLPDEKRLCDKTLELSYLNRIANADFKSFSKGLLSISFNCFATSDDDRTKIEDEILAIIEESSFAEA